MTQFKKQITLVAAICFMLLLSACSNNESKYESIREFEFHFYPEEYEEQYSEITKTLSLDTDIEYQLRLEATCQSGTIKISIMYDGEDEKTYTVSADTPCDELLSISENTVNEVTVSVAIQEETKGTVIGELLSN